MTYSLRYSLAAALLLLGGPVHGQEIPLDPSASSLKFVGHAFMHDFKGECHTFSGSAHLDPKSATLATDAMLTFQVKGMTTFEETRDKNMLAWLQAASFPEIVFRLRQLKPFAGDPRTATQKSPARFSVEGDLVLHGQTHSLKALADGWRSGNYLMASGTTSINTEEYGLPQIHQFFLTVGKQVDLTYQFAFDLPPGYRLPTEK